MNKTKLLSLFGLAFISASALASGHSGTNNDGILDATSPTLAINSYSYNTAIGVRGVGTSGLTIKHFTSRNQAVEGIIGFGPDAFSLTALWEMHNNAFDAPGLSWYYGIGGHLATQSDWVYYDGIRQYRRSNGDFGIGVDGVFGMEYKINEVPIAVSLDVKPFLEVTTHGDVYLAIDPGLGVKFTF